ncbi:zinc-ribbon domain-containing protein [Saccharibacillus kuerlensis]|uniref:Zinc-ribbon domain-containing protein n=1 Tax=Saccharibacillus kuerlensis TaxID=459527 RepID=A0ABQ2KZS0_9BACL|nr:FxLYD domain-containing protein [Saccharibacillus kuerlensis]GGN98124.1 hypothetical protein GCM10010969_16780 [Saccharibacillus kuerlensis]
MYCNHCGAKQPENAAFCSSCGARLLTATEEAVLNGTASSRERSSDPFEYKKESMEEFKKENMPLSGQLTRRSNEAEASVQPAEMERSSSESGTGSKGKTRKSKGGFRHPMWMIPVLLLGIGAGGVYMLYERETGINGQTSELHVEAGALALDGKYDEALAMLDQAAALRPEFAALQTDRTLIETAQRVHEKLDKVSSQLKQNQLETAEKSLGVLEKSLNGRSEPLFEREKTMAADNRDRLSVLLVKQELDKLSDVEALAHKLDEVGRLKAAEADEVEKLIVAKIVSLSTKKAEELLQDKSFSQAHEEVKQGLQYAAKDKNLLALQDRIESEQAAFEAAEQARIERAQQQAQADDLNNRTAAVDVSDMNVTISEYGDITTTGTVTNVATRPIYGIEIHYSAYDAAGLYLFSSSTFASPYRLAPGASGTFSTYDYGWYDYVQIKVDNVTWYLE